MSDKSMIQITGLHKHYGPVHVLDGIDLSVTAGEVVVILGASGSGKSTLIRCINGLETYTSGRLTVDGRELLPLHNRLRLLKAVREEVGMVFQQFNLFPHLSVLENVALAPARFGEGRPVRRRRLR